MATLRVENMYALVGVDGEDGQRALAVEDESVWGFAKGSLVQPGVNAVGAPSGRWLRVLDPTGVLYGVLVTLAADPPPAPPDPPKDTMTDKFHTLREKLLTHALAAFGPGHGAEAPKDKIEEALAIFRVLAAAPERLPKEDELDAKRAASEKVAKGKVEIVGKVEVDTPSAHPSDGWYVLPGKVSNGGAPIPKGTNLVSKGDVLATVKEDGFYVEGDLVPVRVRPGAPPKDGEVVWFDGPVAGVSSTAVLRWVAAPRAEGVTLDALATIASLPKVERAGWYIVPSAPTRDLPHGTTLTVSGPHPLLRLTVAQDTPANAPIPIAGKVDASFFDFGAWRPSGTDVWLTVDDRGPSVRAVLRYLPPTFDVSPPCENVAERVTPEATPKPKVAKAGWYVVPSPRALYAVNKDAKLTFDAYPTLTATESARAGDPIPVTGLLELATVYPDGVDMTCDGAFTWLGRVTLRYLTP